MHEFFEWFRWLYDATGINLTIFYDAFDRSRFVSGFFTTLKLAFSCVVLSVAIGVAGHRQADLHHLGRPRPGLHRRDGRLSERLAAGR